MSTIAYQSAAMGDRHFVSRLFEINESNLIRPDINFFLDANLAVIETRLRDRGDEIDDGFINFLSDVKQEFYAYIAGAQEHYHKIDTSEIDEVELLSSVLGLL